MWGQLFVEGQMLGGQRWDVQRDADVMDADVGIPMLGCLCWGADIGVQILGCRQGVRHFGGD